jgi:asparagine synthase (glutamine-hydrolysing)
MCGIVGAGCRDSFSLVNDNLALLERRGPDHKGAFTFDNCLTLGATRLAMTDPLSRSNQPMIDRESGNAIVFNGEIYNFRKLRSSLIHQNIKFDTESDSEVILKGLTFYGLDFIQKLEGMFSFAFYDKNKGKVILARDFMGKKPLYYATNKNGFYFSSQVNLIKKILKSTSLNLESVSLYLSLGYLIDPVTMYNEILSVEPGEVIIFNIENYELVSKYKFVPNILINPIQQDIRSAVNDAIYERVEGHENFALSVSGGVDSNIILLQSILLGLRVSPFTLRWPNTDKSSYNLDAEAAIKISKKLGTKLNVVDMPKSNDIPKILIDYVHSSSSPNSNPTAISMMWLYAEIKKAGHRLVLTGDGSDEIFGGYRRYAMTNRISWVPKFEFNFLKNFLVNYNSDHSTLQKLIYSITPTHLNESWLYWHLLASHSKIANYCKNLPNPNFSVSNQDLLSIFNKSKQNVKYIMFNDIKVWLPMESNRRLDAISMWHSIEARSPFQSENLIAIGYRGMEKSNFQYLNKEILKQHFPKIDQLPINKVKTGFLSPLGSWLRSNEDLVNDSLNSIGRYIEVDKIALKKLSQSPKKGEYFNFKILWGIIVLEKWFSVHL